ncbi:hypothetical protein [uncultured Mediterranean phage uvMED]|nr:hypothetical protein [uncultured Mediterranean phage uvMED]
MKENNIEFVDQEPKFIDFSGGEPQIWMDTENEHRANVKGGSDEQ